MTETQQTGQEEIKSVDASQENTKDRKKGGCLKGCLTAFLVFVIIIAVGGFMLWQSFPKPGPVARAILETPLDYAATRAVQESIDASGVSAGTVVAVLPLPDERGRPVADGGNITIISMDFNDGFNLTGGEEGMRRQALQIAGSIVDANKAGDLDIRNVNYGFVEGDVPVIGMSVSMNAQQAWVEGRISDEEFLENVGVIVHDVDYVMEVAQRYLDMAIGAAIMRAIFGSFGF